MPQIRNIFCRICGQRTWEKKSYKTSEFKCLGSKDAKMHYYSISKFGSWTCYEKMTFDKYDLIYNEETKKLIISKNSNLKEKKTFDIVENRIPYFTSDDEVDNFLMLS